MPSFTSALICESQIPKLHMCPKTFCVLTSKLHLPVLPNLKATVHPGSLWLFSFIYYFLLLCVYVEVGS